MPDDSSTELFRFTSDAMPDDTFHVVRFHGTEGLNILFKFTIDLVSKNSQIDTGKALMEPVSFHIHRVDAPDAVFRGFLASIRQGGQYNGYTYYTAELRPAFWKLTKIRQSAVFLDKTPADAAAELLNSQSFLPIMHEFRLMCDYPAPEFAMQYEESLYDYILWRMEEQGAYYYFAQDGDCVIFADGPQSHDKAVFSIAYSPASGLEVDMREEVLTSFDLTQTPLPRRVVVRTFDWKSPDKAVSGAALVDARKGLGEVYLNDENVESDAEATRIAKIRAEELVCRSRVFSGAGAVPVLRPGVTFNLERHYNPAFNRDYMVTHITHEGGQESFLTLGLGIPLRDAEDHLFYRNRFSCIEADVPYRPARTAPRAVIPGVIRAFVDGAGSGSRAEMDKYGRYKLIFPFDMSGRKKGGASCWIRMAQPQVGKDSGMSFPLLPGAEVTVAFLGGNPDRPVITGALPNGATGALTGAGNPNFSGIRTPGGNQITINDTDNKQGISLLSASGHGLSFADGSPNLMTLSSDNVISAAGVASSDIAGLAKTFVTGYRSLNAAMQYNAKNLMLWNMLASGMLGTASDVMSTLSSSAATNAQEAAQKGDAATAEESKETSDALSWSSTHAQALSTVISGILTTIFSAKMGKLGYNVSLMGGKEVAMSAVQVAPSKAKLIAAMAAWLGVRLGGETASNYQTAQQIEKSYDAAQGQAQGDKAALDITEKDYDANWNTAYKSYEVSGTSLLSDITAAVCAMISTAKKENELGGISLTAMDSNINVSAQKTVSAHSCEGIYLRTTAEKENAVNLAADAVADAASGGPLPSVIASSMFGSGTGDRTSLGDFESNVKKWQPNKRHPFDQGYIALDSSLLCEQADDKLSRVQGASLSRADTHIWRSGKNTMLLQKQGADAGIHLASEDKGISLDVKDKATAALDKDGVLLVGNKTGLLLQSAESGAAVLKADTACLTLEKGKALLSTDKAKIFCGDDIRLEGKKQTQIQKFVIKNNDMSAENGIITIAGSAVKVVAGKSQPVKMSESKADSIKTRYDNLTADNGMIGCTRKSVQDIPETD